MVIVIVLCLLACLLNLQLDTLKSIMHSTHINIIQWGSTLNKKVSVLCVQSGRKKKLTYNWKSWRTSWRQNSTSQYVCQLYHILSLNMWTDVFELVCVSVLLFVFEWNIFPWFQKLYKTQIRELKEESDEKTKLYKDAQQRLEDLLEERCVCVCVFAIIKGCWDISEALPFFLKMKLYQ